MIGALKQASNALHSAQRASAQNLKVAERHKQPRRTLKRAESGPHVNQSEYGRRGRVRLRGGPTAVGRPAVPPSGRQVLQAAL